VYFALTFVRVGGEQGPLLAYHVSWHKPATPLAVGIKTLYADPGRHVWLIANLRLHTWDRGGNGAPLLGWAAMEKIPYLTVANGSVYISAQRSKPVVRTSLGVPVFVVRDVRLPARGDGSPVPRIIVFPARPEKGAAGKRALRFPTNAELPEGELATVNDVYKTRWPDMENQIKALIASGFGVNRDRTLKLTTSRGVDGKVERAIEHEAELMDQFEAVRQQPMTAKNFDKALRVVAKVGKEQSKRAALEALPLTKGAREAGHGELLCKTVMLMMYNALAVLLASSPLPAVRAMTPARVRDLLLGQPALVSMEGRRLTVWVEALADVEQRRLQAEVVRLFNELGRLRLTGYDAVAIRLVERRGIRRR
jgi:hypothetical protein